MPLWKQTSVKVGNIYLMSIFHTAVIRKNKKNCSDLFWVVKQTRANRRVELLKLLKLLVLKLLVVRVLVPVPPASVVRVLST